MVKPKYGYDINTGEPIHKWEDRLIYMGDGTYKKASSITKEDVERKKIFCASVTEELQYFLQGQTED